MGLFGKNTGKRIPIKKFAAGEVVIREGDRAACMFDIKEGSVAVYQNYGTPIQRQVATLKKGDYFGEMAVIESQPRNATVIVLEGGATIQIVSSDDFYQYVRENPEQIMLILQRMGKRIHTVSDEFIDACETIYDIDECRKNNTEPGVDLNARIKVYATRYEKNK